MRIGKSKRTFIIIGRVDGRQMRRRPVTPPPSRCPTPEIDLRHAAGLCQGHLSLCHLFIGHVRLESCFVSETLTLKTLWWFLLLVTPILSLPPAVQRHFKEVSTWGTGGDFTVILDVDIGGTFTDLLLPGPKTWRFEIAGVPLRPADQSDGFKAGNQALGDGPRTLDRAILGTTVGANSLPERKSG